MKNPRLASFALCLLATSAVAAEEFPALLDWSQRAVLSTPVSGVVSEVAVHPGQQVAAGQLLLQLDQRPFETRVQDAQAQLHKHQLQRDEARRELDRTRELYNRRVISTHDLQLAEIAFATAQSDYASAKAALEEATLDSEYSRLQAPFAGVVLGVDVSAGMTVINTQQATPLVTLAQDRPLYALAQVSGAALSGLTAGQSARISVNGEHFDGRLEFLAAEPDTHGQYTLTFSFDPGTSRLRAGQAARVGIP
jgi:multidrug efflux system membrane fusion protein